MIKSEEMLYLYIAGKLLERLLEQWARDKMAAKFADDIFKCIFLIEKVWISIKISPKFVPKDPINNMATDNGLVPNRRQAIIWTSDGLFYWSIYDAFMRHSASMS